MRVFIVDDYKNIAIPLCDNFEILGHEAKFILKSQKAVSEVMEFKPDWLVLDIRMPYKSGLDIYRELKENADFQFKVVFYSLYFDDPEILKGLEDLKIPGDIRIDKTNDIAGDVPKIMIPALEAGRFHGREKK